MSFSRLLYLVSQGPRLIRLVLEIWRILAESDDEKLKRFLNDSDELYEKLKNANSKEDRMRLAVDISRFLGELR